MNKNTRRELETLSVEWGFIPTLSGDEYSLNGIERKELLKNSFRSNLKVQNCNLDLLYVLDQIGPEGSQYCRECSRLWGNCGEGKKNGCQKAADKKPPRVWEFFGDGNPLSYEWDDYFPLQ